MIERGDGARLALEALERSAIPGQRMGHELDGDDSSEAGIFGPIDDTHPALAEWRENAVMRDGLAEDLFGRTHQTDP